MQLTVDVSDGTTTHGDPKLICTPTQWADILAFFLTNYVTHAITITSSPGQSVSETIFYALNALFVPGFGAIRTLSAIRAHAGTIRNNELRKAATAGALCMLISSRNFFALQDRLVGDERTWFKRAFHDVSLTLEVPRGRSIHGICNYPIGRYTLVQVPPHIPLRALGIQQLTPVRGYTRKVLLSSSYNIPKALFALVQAVWGVLTLYRTRGNQIDIMMNIIANIVAPEYPAMYLVHTPDMDDAEAEGGRFHGVVASVDLDAIDRPLRLRHHVSHHRFGFAIKAMSYLLVSITPIAVVMGLFKGKLGSVTESDSSQAGWMLSWLVVGADGLGYSVYFAITVVMLVSVAPLWIASIGGMVVVGRQLLEYGTCVRLSF